MCGIFSPHLVDFYGKQKIYSYHTCTGMGMISRRAGNFGRELSIAKRGEHDNVSPQRLCGLQWFMSNSPRRCPPQQWLWYFVSRGSRLCHFKLKLQCCKTLPFLGWKILYDMIIYDPSFEYPSFVSFFLAMHIIVQVCSDTTANLILSMMVTVVYMGSTMASSKSCRKSYTVCPD